MFSGLNQGSRVYILNKTNGIEYKIGEVVGTTTPIFATDGTNMMVVNLKVKVDGSNVDYNNVPANNTSVSYNNGNLIIAESKQTIQSEVEATLQHANYVVEHIEDYKAQITKCEEVLKELNPQFAKDKARDERIAGIENEVAGMKGDIAKILAAVTKIKIMIIMVQRNMNKSELKEKIRRMKMEIQELEECLDKYEERDNRYDDEPQYRNRNQYDDEERYHEREEYGHRERGRYGRY